MDKEKIKQKLLAEIKQKGLYPFMEIMRFFERIKKTPQGFKSLGLTKKKTIYWICVSEMVDEIYREMEVK